MCSSKTAAERNIKSSNDRKNKKEKGSKKTGILREAVSFESGKKRSEKKEASLPGSTALPYRPAGFHLPALFANTKRSILSSPLPKRRARRGRQCRVYAPTECKLQKKDETRPSVKKLTRVQNRVALIFFVLVPKSERDRRRPRGAQREVPLSGNTVTASSRVVS
jgi:hypothetical protein